MVSPGDTIGGKYRLLEKLDEGGMGFIYEAEHLTIGGRVAVKFLHQDVSYDASSILRFKREARAAAAIGHEAIVDVYDMDTTDDGVPFIVMELLKGQTLRQRLSIEPQLELSFASYVACQVLSALSAAHEQKIVHRDLKPENIFLIENNTMVPPVKLLDFGISCAIEGSNPTEEQQTRITRTGALIGTPEYMSPEQARGLREIDHLTDIYSMGLIIYECVTGKLVFRGTNYNDVIARILTTEPPRPTAFRSDLPLPFEEAILKAIEKSPTERIQSANELFRLLIPFVNSTVVGRLSLPSGVSDEDFEVVLEETDKYPSASTFNQDGDIATLTPQGITAPSPLSKLAWPKISFIGAAALILLAIISGVILLTWSASEGDEPLAELNRQIPSSLIESGPSKTDASNDSGPIVDKAPGVVLVELQDLPRGARVFVDDVLTDGNPLRFEEGAPMFSLKVEADGYKTYRRMLTPRNVVHDVDMELNQEEVVSKQKKRPWIRRPGKKLPPPPENEPEQVEKKQPGYRPSEW